MIHVARHEQVNVVLHVSSTTHRASTPDLSFVVIAVMKPAEILMLRLAADARHETGQHCRTPQFPSHNEIQHPILRSTNYARVTSHPEVKSFVRLNPGTRVRSPVRCGMAKHSRDWSRATAQW